MRRVCSLVMSAMDAGAHECGRSELAYTSCEKWRPQIESSSIIEQPVLIEQAVDAGKDIFGRLNDLTLDSIVRQRRMIDLVRTRSYSGDTHYAPFGKNAEKHLWFIGMEER